MFGIGMVGTVDETPDLRKGSFELLYVSPVMRDEICDGVNQRA